MENINLPLQMSEDAIAEENARFMSKVYMWMSVGILLTALVSYFVANNPSWVQTIVMNRNIFYALLFTEIAMVLGLSLLIQRISALTATLLFLAYSAVSGLTLSVIFLVFTQDSIAQVFLFTSFAFGGLSAFGYFTKRDLGPVGSFCMTGLFGLLGFGLCALIFPSIMTHQANIIYNLVGIIVFSGLTAYDTQKIKELNVIGNEGTPEDEKEAIYGALTLYLDFINLFLSLLNIFGKRK